MIYQHALIGLKVEMLGIHEQPIEVEKHKVVMFHPLHTESVAQDRCCMLASASNLTGYKEEKR